MTIDEAKEQISTFERFAEETCINCVANDWYCPSYCPELEKAQRIPFNIIQEQYAKYDGDPVKMHRYIKNTRYGAGRMRSK